MANKSIESHFWIEGLRTIGLSLILAFGIKTFVIATIAMTAIIGDLFLAERL